MIVNYFVKRKIAYIELNRPEKKNSLNSDMIDKISTYLNLANSEFEVGAIVIKAKGNIFCSGMDLSELNILQTQSLESNISSANKLRDLLINIYNSKKIITAQIEGDVYGGGCAIISACDFIFSVPNSTFCYPEVKLCFVAALAAPFIIKKIGINRARYLLLTGERIDTNQAMEYGLINNIYSSSKINIKIEEYINNLLKFNSLKAISLTKEFLNDISRSSSLKESLTKGAILNAKTRLLDECKSRVKEFLEKNL